MSSDQGKGSRQADHWKKKYYDSLDDLETREKQWSELEALLRQLVSRLTLAVYTDDTSFARQLEKLRNSIRDSRDLLLLRPLITDISGYIAKHDLPAGNSGDSNPALALEQLLDELDIPKSLQRQEKHVRKQLGKTPALADIPPVVKQLAELLGLIIDEIAEQRISGLQQGKTKEKGLLANLFAKDDKKEDKTAEENTEEEQQSKTPELQETAKEAAPAGSTDREYQLAGDILIQLLERLDLPDDLSTEAGMIRKKLEPCENEATLTGGLDASVKLLADMNRRVQQEKLDLEAFLKQLTERLHELDTDIRETVRLRDDSLDEGRKMNAAVSDEVKGIQQSVDTAIDLNTLKTAVQSRVVIIRNHVDRFLEGEENRQGESQQVIKRLEQQLEKTQQETEKLRAEMEKAQRQSMTDNLTGVPNRFAYDQQLKDELARFKRYKSAFVILVWDVDKFKSINDTYGHAAGDKVLRIIASVLHKNIRETDFIARYGGEEFVAILPETGLEAARTVAEKLRQAVEQTEFHFRKQRVIITASCGVASCDEGDTEITLFERADKALYQAKQKGRNRIELA